MEPIAIGDVLDGKYVIEGMLGEGAMGVVFSARHRALNKRVAVKTLRAEIAQDTGLVGRFEQEARAASAIGHPNIIEVFDLGSAPGGARYMVMEYLHGESLADIITQRPYQTAERAVFLMGQVLSALGAAHKQGIIHRDLKPENIFVVRAEERPETVKLLDFGISKVLSEIADPRIAGTNSDARATRLGMVMGTPLYMAPEQARGLLDLDHRVDLWAVAVVIYELMCGRPPFDGENYNQILGAILQGELAPPRTYCPQIVPALEAVILKGLAYDRADRFQSAAAMRQALEAVLTHPAAPRPAPGNATAALTPQRAAPSSRPAPAPGPVGDLDLDGISSDALSIAGKGSVESEAALLSAMERIAGGSAEIGLGPAAEPEPPPPANPVSTPAPAHAPQATPRGAARFAPPESQSEDLVLDLATPKSEPPAARARDAAVTAERAPPRRTTHATTVSRGPGLPVGTLLVGLLVLGLLAAGGVAGYRYATKGYLLEPPATPRLGVQVTTTPPEAEVRVDGLAVPSRSFELTPGASARVRAVAPGRVSREIAVVAEGDRIEPVVLVLPHQLGPSSLYVSADRDDRHGPAAAAGDAVLDAALTKLDRYVDCLIPLIRVLANLRDEYRRVTRGSAANIRRNNIPLLAPLPLPVVSACRASLEAAPGTQPRFPAIDEPARSLMTSVDELDVLLEDLGGYYVEERYFNDDLKYGRKMHRRLVQAFDASWNAASIATTVAERRAYWQRVELEGIARHEGETAHWQLRRLALAVQLWQGSVARHGPGKARADELRAAFDQVVAYGAAHSAEMQDVQGSVNFVAGVKTLLDRLAGGTLSAAQAFAFGDTCIADFNAMVL